MPLTARQIALLLLIFSAALLGGAFAFEHFGGLAPCVLCWWQRYAHMAVMALAVIAVLAPENLRPYIVALAALALITGAGIAGFHVGVEQHWWQGTAECGSTLQSAGSIEELRARLLAQPLVRCDEVAWSLFGISMAGYNFLLSLIAAIYAGLKLMKRV